MGWGANARDLRVDQPDFLQNMGVNKTVNRFLFGKCLINCVFYQILSCDAVLGKLEKLWLKPFRHLYLLGLLGNVECCHNHIGADLWEDVSTFQQPKDCN